MASRRARRFPVELPASIAGRAAAVTVDLSPSGMSVLSAELLAPGEPVHGVVWFGGKRLSWSGWVVWSRPGNPMAQAWHQAGIRVERMAPGLTALISLTSKVRR